MNAQCTCRVGTRCFRLKPGLDEAVNWNPLCHPCQMGNHAHGYGAVDADAQLDEGQLGAIRDLLTWIEGHPEHTEFVPEIKAFHAAFRGG